MFRGWFPPSGVRVPKKARRHFFRSSKTPASRRPRIVPLFALGIVLPSLILGYLAFRGVQNDRALIEKEKLEQTRRAADRIIGDVDGTITNTESALSTIVVQSSETPSAETLEALERFGAKNAAVEQVFRVRDGDDIIFPVARPLYVADGVRKQRASQLSAPEKSAAIKAAESSEFQERDYARALAAYRRALVRVTDRHAAGIIRNAIARVQRKCGFLEDAVSTYETIVRDHGDTVAPGGMPLGPSAALEICSLTRELKDFPKSLRTSLDLYRSLLLKRWTLERAEYEFFTARIRAHIEGLSSGRPPGLDLQAFQKEFRDLEKTEAESLRETERMIGFAQGAGPVLESRMKTVGGGEAPNPRFVRMALDLGNRVYLVSMEMPATAASQAPPDGTTDTAWGIIFNGDRLKESVLGPALREQVPSREMSWALRARDGAVILSSENPASGPVILRTGFASNFPDWTLEFHQPPPRLIKTFLLSRRGLYFFAFLLIAGILVFGLVLTVRSVSHELELARMKSDFVSTVSHEFKSPLTSIRQLAEMLHAGRVPSEERRQKYYDVLLEQSERLSMLTDNILSLAKIEEGRAEFSFEATDISALLADVVTASQERVRHEGFDIGLEVSGTLPRLAVDRTALSQAVTNLVDNAIKYSGESRTIAVSAALDDRSLAIAVRDFGVGIGREDRDRVFERFYRGGDALTRTVKGSGLGLTLVKEIVEAHRGRVDVESEPGKGSVFTIRLLLPSRKEG